MDIILYNPVSLAMRNNERKNIGNNLVSKRAQKGSKRFVDDQSIIGKYPASKEQHQYHPGLTG